MDVDKKGLKDHILKYFVIAIFSLRALSTTMFYSTSTSLFYNIDQEEFAALNNLVKKQDNETAFLSESNKILTRHSERINKFMDKNLSISDIYTIKSELDGLHNILKEYLECTRFPKIKPETAINSPLLSIRFVIKKSFAVDEVNSVF